MKEKFDAGDKLHYYQIDALKGIAIFLVLLGHSIIYFPINLHVIPWCQWIFAMLSSFHMPLFFAISGFCYHYREGNGYFSGYLKKKVQRILIPYLLFGFFDMIPRIFLSQFVNRPDAHWQDSVQNIFFYGGQYWFLYVLFLIFLLFPVLQTSLAKMGGGYVILLAAGFAVTYEYMPRIFLLSRVAYYLIYFSLGVWLRKEFDGGRAAKCQVIINRKWGTGFFLLWLLGMIFSHEMEYNGYRILLAILGSLWVTIFVLSVKRNRVIKYMENLGKYSLQLYLLNGFTLGLSRLLICKVTAIPWIVVAFNMLIDCHGAYLLIDQVMAKIKILRRIAGIV